VEYLPTQFFYPVNQHKMANEQIKEEKIFGIAFQWDGKQYKGWVNPSDQLTDTGAPTSFHVVLNEVSFGHLNYKDCKWHSSEGHPAGLVKLVGKEIEKHYQL
jgi:hypothetical protein